MAATTGPILAVGAITAINRSVLHSQPFDWRLPVATGAAAGALALIEKAAPQAAVMLSWAALVTVLFTRIGGVPAPTEAFLTWWNAGATK